MYLLALPAIAKRVAGAGSGLAPHAHTRSERALQLEGLDTAAMVSPTHACASRVLVSVLQSRLLSQVHITHVGTWKLKGIELPVDGKLLALVSSLSLPPTPLPPNPVS